ncbi:MAG: FAD-dependent oxidoreductase [Bacillota bacterium]
MQNKEERIYDYIVYGATLPGVVLALLYSASGKSVMLLNHHGFMGGSITESLNCIQKIDLNLLKPLTKKIYYEIVKAQKDELSKKDELVFINPESVKLVLQSAIEESNVECLFHIKAKSVNYKPEGFFSVNLVSKDGGITLSGKNLIDATEDYYLSRIHGAFYKTEMRAARFNCIITSREADDLVKELNPLDFCKISDQRLWVSLKINNNNEMPIDLMAQEAADNISEKIKASAARIQVLPTEVQQIYKISSYEEEMPSGFLQIDSLTGGYFPVDELFHKTSSLE